MKKHTIFIVVLILFAFGATTLALQNGYDLFQKALAKERAEGNLEEAITLYKKVIAEAKDEALAAKAQLRIGFCYEKLGLSEAQKAFQKVVDNYPGQTESVKVAKEKLSILVKAKSVVEKGEMEFGIRPVWSKPKWDIEGAPSPDGKYLSYVDWDTGDLAYKEIATGKTYRLTDKDRVGNYEDCAYDSKWSPDSKQIAYCWENDKEEYVDLRIVGIDDNKPRILHRVDYRESWVAPADWTPDGKHILVRLLGTPFKFGLVSVVDGSLRIIKEIDIWERYNNPGGGLFSPDGKYIAYDSQQNADSPHHDIHLLSNDGKTNVLLASHPAHDYFLGWEPDGNRIIFASDRTGTVDLWMVSVEAGRQKGDPVLLRRNIGSIKPLGLTRDGSFYFNTSKGNVPYDIYTAAIDTKTGMVINSAKKLILPYEGNNTYPAWSPDGKYLAYTSRRGITSSRTLCIFSVESGEIHVIPYESHVAWPRWSPDGHFILAYVEDVGICKVDVQTGKFLPLLKYDRDHPIYSPDLSPDNRYLFYAQFDRDEKITHVRARDLSTKKDKKLYSIPLHEHDMALSPDGRYLALMCSDDPYENRKKEHMLRIIPTDGGQVREVHNFVQEGGWGLVDVAWSPDGQYVYFSKISAEQSGDKPFDWDLWRVSVEGGKAEKVGLVMQRFRSLSIHPDGQQIAFASHAIGVKPAPEVWVMENFLPKK
jgi:Tol biopolymer transport system component